MMTSNKIITLYTTILTIIFCFIRRLFPIKFTVSREEGDLSEDSTFIVLIQLICQSKLITVLETFLFPFLIILIIFLICGQSQV